MVRGVIFDCFGVLYGSSLRELANRAEDNDQREEVLSLNKQADYGFIDQDAYMEGLAVVLNTTYEDIRAFLRQRHVKNERLFAYVFELKKRGYKIGLLSNVSSGGLDGLFSEQELNAMFDATILSYEEGITKPHPNVFELSAERLGVPAGECVMIDDLESNCDGAEIAGLYSIQHITNASTIEQLEALLHPSPTA